MLKFTRYPMMRVAITTRLEMYSECQVVDERWLIFHKQVYENWTSNLQLSSGKFRPHT